MNISAEIWSVELRRWKAARIMVPAVRTVTENSARGRLREAALRLRHDLGKYVRLRAPAAVEENVEELRERLAADLLRTQSGPARVRSAAEIYESWREEEGRLFLAEPSLRGRIAAIEEAIARIRASVPRLSELTRRELERLDDATRVIAQETRALWRDVSGEAPERRQG
jgi:hypothetical protein